MSPTNQSTIEENLLQQMIATVQSGTHYERITVINRIHSLLDVHLPTITNALLPVVCGNVTKWSEELQTHCARMIISLILPTMPSQAANQICTAAAHIVRNTHIDPPFFNWADILIAVIPHTNLSDHSRMRDLLLTLFGHSFAGRANAVSNEE